MSTEDIEKLRYPIGKFQFPKTMERSVVENDIHIICHFPQVLRETVQYLNDEQLNTPYRPDGWTVRQLVHHLADSHMNSYIRFKWTLTEEQPTIKAYEEKKWAELPDAKNDPIESSLLLLTALHLKWTNVLNNLNDDQINRAFVYPQNGRQIKIYENIALYAWHCNHHLNHILKLIERMNW